MDRRDFLKRLGFLTAALPLAGFKPKEDETVPDIIEIEAVVEEEEPEELSPGYFDQPYYSDAAWVSPAWYSDGKLIINNAEATISDGKWYHIALCNKPSSPEDFDWDADDEA